MNRFNKSQLSLNYNDIDFFNKEFVMWRRFIHFKNNVFYYNSNTKKYQLEKPEYDFVEYKVNKNGFRCDNFDANLKTNILFNGCSETMGEGGPLETSWAYNLNSQSDCGGYYNLSIPGSGYDTIIDNTIRYFKKINIPKNLFILFPNIDRKILYGPKVFRDENDQHIKYHEDDIMEYFDWPFQSIEYWDFIPKKYPSDFSINDLEYKTLFAYRVKQIEMLEFLCNSLNINFRWSTYCKLDQENFNKINTFQNHLNFDHDKLEQYIFKYEKNNPTIDYVVRKADGHNGLAWHNYVANIFQEYLV